MLLLLSGIRGAAGISYAPFNHQVCNKDPTVWTHRAVRILRLAAIRMLNPILAHIAVLRVPCIALIQKSNWNQSFVFVHVINNFCIIRQGYTPDIIILLSCFIRKRRI